MAGRPPLPAHTDLGAASRARRAATQAARSGGADRVPRSPLTRIERGAHRASLDTARALARRVGWTLEEVLDAAERPADLPARERST
jgi:DNA-binding XRE family transcriptional regulator